MSILMGNRTIVDAERWENHLHGADGFWNKYVWIARPFENEQEQAVEMSYRSPDGEEGYPGNRRLPSLIRCKNNALKIEYQAMTDAPTILNPTTIHNFFNLHGNTASVPIRMC